MSDRDLSLYRPNVGVALFNTKGLVWIGRRIDVRDEFCWQMPQGGIDHGENVTAAALRELREETGIPAHLTKPLGAVDGWLTYDFPPHVRARKPKRKWVGQKQKWVALRFIGQDNDVDIAADDHQEFDDWRWERLEALPEMIIPWKRSVYKDVTTAFAQFAAE